MTDEEKDLKSLIDFILKIGKSLDMHDFGYFAYHLSDEDSDEFYKLLDKYMKKYEIEFQDYPYGKLV